MRGACPGSTEEGRCSGRIPWGVPAELAGEGGWSTHQPGKKVGNVPEERSVGWGHGATGGQCFRVQDRGGRCCLRALAGHDTNVEFTPEGHRELLKAFRQKSARLKQAFLKAAPAVLWGAEHGGRGPDEARGLEPPRGEQGKGQTRSLIWMSRGDSVQNGFWSLALVLGGSEAHSWPRLGRKKRWFGRKDDVLHFGPAEFEGSGMRT